MNKDIWEQIKSIDKKTLISALKKDGWVYDTEHNRFRTYRKGSNKITVHYHNTTFRNPKLLKRILADIGWTDDDFYRLKLVK